MAFCSHGLKAAKNILHKLDDKLEPIIDNVLNFTGTIMKGSAWPLIEAALQSLPYGELVDKGLHMAINALTDSKELVSEQDLAKKLQLFVADVQKWDPLRQHATLIKVASILTAVIHDNEETESTYDSLTQLKAVVLNAEKKAA